MFKLTSMPLYRFQVDDCLIKTESDPDFFPGHERDVRIESTCWQDLILAPNTVAEQQKVVAARGARTMMNRQVERECASSVRVVPELANFQQAEVLMGTSLFGLELHGLQGCTKSSLQVQAYT